MIDVPARSQSPLGDRGADRVRPVLKRPRDERGGQPGLAGGRQVAVVRRGEHHLARLEPEQRGRPPVRLRVRLVRARQVGAEDEVPVQPGRLRHVEQQRRVPVRQRPDDVAPLDGRDPGRAVRPRGQEVPGARQPVQFPGREAARVDAVLAQRLVQVLPVQHIQRDERPRARAHPLHGRLVPAPPGVGERVRVEFQAMPVGERARRPQRSRTASRRRCRTRRTAPPARPGRWRGSDTSRR